MDQSPEDSHSLVQQGKPEQQTVESFPCFKTTKLDDMPSLNLTMRRRKHTSLHILINKPDRLRQSTWTQMASSNHQRNQFCKPYNPTL